MRRGCNAPGVRRASQLLGIVLLCVAALSLGACKSRNEPITEVASAPVETGTVQAQLPVDPNSIAVPDIPTSATPAGTTTAPPPSQTQAVDDSKTFKEATSPDPTKPGAWWPKRVGSFAAAFTAPTWYPKWLPKGYKFESLDIIEFDTDVDSGLACDIVFLNGDKVLQFTEGSPKARNYEIVSAGEVPWGTATAHFMHQDPADSSTPMMVVLNQDGNFAELSGDVSDEVLKKIAASMVVIK